MNVTSATIEARQGLAGALLGVGAAAQPAPAKALEGPGGAVSAVSGRAPAPNAAPLVDGATAVTAQEQGAARVPPTALTEEEQRIVRELRRRDAEVRRHERAHAAAGGPVTGAPIYEFQRGPDGRFYAVDGEVRIDVSPESDPRATIAKMELVIRAALAPAEPSAQDRSVAAQAKQIKLEAERELAELQAEERGLAGGPRQRAGDELEQEYGSGFPGGSAENVARAYGRSDAAGAIAPEGIALFRDALSITA